jgi:hypothetical protein
MHQGLNFIILNSKLLLQMEAQNMKTFIRIIMVLAMAATAAPALAGSLDGPGAAPALGSGMPTTAEIYERLNSGAAIATPPGAFREPTAGPTAGTGKSLSDIKAKLPVPDNTNGAKVGDVLSGKTFWGLRTDGTWGLKSGAVAAGSNVSGGNGLRTFTIPNGLYSGGKSATAVDANLITGNIRSGVSIFGVSGKESVVDTASGTAVAGDMLTGKTAYVNGAQVTGTAAAGGNVTGGNGSPSPFRMGSTAAARAPRQRTATCWLAISSREQRFSG